MYDTIQHLTKRTIYMLDIALNLKRKRQGLGYYQLSEQLYSEERVEQFLYHLTTKTKLDKKEEKEKHPWTSIRGISKRTGLHYNTVRKAVTRLKEENQIIEMYGTKKARLFTPVYSANADNIRKQCKEEPKFQKWLLKINNKTVLRELKLNKWNEPIYPSKNRKGYRDRILTKERQQHKDDMKRSSDIFNAVIKKRQTISLKNRKNVRKKRIVSQLVMRSEKYN